ncbi:hypothetical protein GGI02_002333 [Coemansia sp. RSA 2322]|nr:hypothetical protein GGI02_002333 [Coemansia sp. RSA 2322]KAJ2471844.1 hypothetical protein EV174_005904 [Coemansia sp. RSA 2320]
MIGRLIHYSIDLVLVSTALAGIRRSTGLTPKLDEANSAVQGVLRQYLDVGEHVIDYAKPWLADSKLFTRK